MPSRAGDIHVRGEVHHLNGELIGYAHLFSARKGIHRKGLALGGKMEAPVLASGRDMGPSCRCGSGGTGRLADNDQGAAFNHVAGTAAMGGLIAKAHHRNVVGKHLGAALCGLPRIGAATGRVHAGVAQRRAGLPSMRTLGEPLTAGPTTTCGQHILP